MNQGTESQFEATTLDRLRPLGRIGHRISAPTMKGILVKEQATLTQPLLYDWE